MLTFARMIRRLPVIGSFIAWRESRLWEREHYSAPNGWARKDGQSDYGPKHTFSLPSERKAFAAYLRNTIRSNQEEI